MKHELRIMVFAVIVLFMIHNSLFIIPVYAAADLGQSRIHPASPLYFLKSVREILELKLAGTTHVKALRRLEFTIRRIREVKSLAGTPREDLIEPTLGRYLSELDELRGVANVKDKIMVEDISRTTASQMEVLQKTYGQVSNPKAKRSIRAAIFRLSEWQQSFIDRLDLVKQSAFADQLRESKLLGCNFLATEASSSALNEIEKTVYAERTQKCLINP